MIEIKSNASEIIAQLNKQVGALLDTDKMLRLVATSMVPVMRMRVHEQGKDSKGAPIGLYSHAYWKRRQKPPVNRTADRNVVISLFRFAENDMRALPTATGWAVGYTNALGPTLYPSQKPITNIEKVQYVERLYKTKILTELSADEDRLVGEIVEDYLTEIIDQL